MLKKIILFILAMLSLSCKGTRKVATTTSSKSVSVREKLHFEFEKYKNTPYKYGGTTSKGFDCSGFVNTVYKNAFGIQLPRTTSEMKKVGSKIEKSKLKAGDLLFFNPTRTYNHVGIYLENGIMIHSSSSKGVIKTSIEDTYWKKHYTNSRRILK